MAQTARLRRRFASGLGEHRYRISSVSGQWRQTTNLWHVEEWVAELWHRVCGPKLPPAPPAVPLQRREIIWGDREYLRRLDRAILGFGKTPMLDEASAH